MTEDPETCTHVDLGIAYIQMGLLADAAAELAKALVRDPKNARALHWREQLLSLQKLNRGFASLHDGRLTSLSLAPVRLCITRVDGTLAEVVLRDVEAMCCNNFREGNIVFALEVTMDVERLEPKHLQGLCQTTEQSLVDAYYDTLKKRSVVYFLLGSSYGAELVAVCPSLDSIAMA